MKNKTFSFLFFCLISLWGGRFTLEAQIQRDTINKYYNSIVSPNGKIAISEGIKFYTSKKEYDTNLNDTLKIIQDLRLIAMGQFEIGNIYDSESAVVEAITLIDNYQQKDTLIESRKALYNQLGNIYGETKNYNKAIESYNLSLNFSKNASHSITLINNKAYIYIDWRKYQKAAEELNFAHKKFGADTNSLQLAFILDNLGLVQSKLGNPEALTNLKKSLMIRESKNNLSGIYSSNKNLSIFYFDRNKKADAYAYAEKAFQIATQMNSVSYLQDALSLFAIMNDDPKIVQFKKITDSIAKEKQLTENKNAFIKYNVANEKKKTSEALLEKEKEKNQKLIFLILGIIIALTSIFIYFALRIRHKKEK